MDNETRLKYSTVDPETCDINELKDEIKRLENMSAYYDTKQLAIKKFLNSIYGSCASKYFIGFNVDIAEAITLQGQDLNHFSENAVNYYFKNIFPFDEELHKKLGIDTELAKQFDIDKGRITEQKPLIGKDFAFLKEPVSMVIAGDTDSLYVEGNRVCAQLNIPHAERTKFIVKLWEEGLEPYINQCYEDYAKKFNCDKNVQKLELEKISDTSLMVAKKHYAMSECFLEPNIYLRPGDKVIYKGLELIQGATPIFVRKCQDDFYRYILNWYDTNSTPPPFIEVYNKIKQYKSDFLKQNPNDISKSFSIGDYDKFILDDKNNIVVGEHCPIHVKAAGIANFILNKPENKRFRTKYNRLKTRDKIKFYYTTDPKYPVFAFQPNKFPLEYAPSIDYNQQFEKLILEPINKIMDIMKYRNLTSDLCYTTSLF